MAVNTPIDMTSCGAGTTMGACANNASLHRSQVEDAFVWNPTGSTVNLPVNTANMPTIIAAPAAKTCAAEAPRTRRLRTSLNDRNDRARNNHHGGRQPGDRLGDNQLCSRCDGYGSDGQLGKQDRPERNDWRAPSIKHFRAAFYTTEAPSLRRRIQMVRASRSVQAAADHRMKLFHNLRNKEVRT